MLAREQSVDADSRFGGEFLEARPFDFVRDKDFALLFGEIVDRRVEFFEENASRIGGLRARIGRGQ
jgi:hypothetical protein